MLSFFNLLIKMRKLAVKNSGNFLDIRWIRDFTPISVRKFPRKFQPVSVSLPNLKRQKRQILPEFSEFFLWGSFFFRARIAFLPYFAFFTSFLFFITKKYIYIPNFNFNFNLTHIIPVATQPRNENNPLKKKTNKKVTNFNLKMPRRYEQQRRNTRQRMRRRSEDTKKKSQAGFEPRLWQNRTEVYIPCDSTSLVPQNERWCPLA